MSSNNMNDFFSGTNEKFLNEKESYWDKIRKKENKGGLPYFYFTHNEREYEIQAVNEVAAKAKFDKIILNLKN